MREVRTLWGKKGLKYVPCGGAYVSCGGSYVPCGVIRIILNNNIVLESNKLQRIFRAFFSELDINRYY